MSRKAEQEIDIDAVMSDLTDNNLCLIREALEYYKTRISNEIKLTRTQALMLLVTGYSEANPNSSIMCKEYGDDEDWIGMCVEDVENLATDDGYKTFEIW